MGTVFEARCRKCAHEFEASDGGGGFMFAEFRCDACGGMKHIRCPDRRRTAAQRTAETDAEWERWGEKLKSMDLRCPCGGEFKESSPVRCPKCGSTDIAKGETVLCYD
jgi:predicted Zn-ribbon and HTH transcriptional regulator